MNQEILELLAEKKYSAVKQLIGQMEEADLAKLFEELENEEDADQFNRLFRLLPRRILRQETGRHSVSVSIGCASWVTVHG